MGKEFSCYSESHRQIGTKIKFQSSVGQAFLPVRGPRSKFHHLHNPKPQQVWKDFDT